MAEASRSLRPPPPLDATVRPAGSKSLTNRALLFAALARGRSHLRSGLVSEDTEVMERALVSLGVAIDRQKTEFVIDGRGRDFAAGMPSRTAIACGTAGTATRFLTATLAAMNRDDIVVTFDGSPRMRERPMADLTRVLVLHGADLRHLAAPDHLPFELRPRGLDVTRPFAIGRPASSQFVSGLVYAAACLPDSSEIVLAEGTPSRPYVDMTLDMLVRFGGRFEDDGRRIRVHPRELVGCELEIEPDASNASYFLALAAIWGGRMTVNGLGHESVQGDARFCDVLERMGAKVEQEAERTTVHGSGTLHGIVVDLDDMPDTTPTLCVTALFARGPTTITGVEILRHHESDRLAACAIELRKLGAEVTELRDGLHIVPPTGGPTRGVQIATYDDHRMAMAFSLVGDVVIENPGCTAKTYPGYFDELATLGMWR